MSAAIIPGVARPPLLSGPEGSGAEISACGTYRYALWRKWSPTLPLATFVMCNPSTADANEDDATIRKCMGFAHRWGLGGIWVVNLFALRSTDPRALLTASDPVGPDNDGWLANACSFEPSVVCAWGSPGGARVAAMLSERAPTLVHLAYCHEGSLQCLGTSKDGSPRHPLMLGYSVPRQAWPLKGGAR